jgi:hypothetical protein
MVVSRRARFALPLLAAAIVLMPVVFESPQMNTVGTYWQGRYWLPLLVGLPLVASSVLPRTIFGAALSAVHARYWRVAGFAALVALLVAAELGAFLTALQRYETGLGTKPAGAVDWAPQGGTALVIALFVIGQLLLVGFVAWNSLHAEAVEPAAPVPDEHALSESVPSS